MDDLSHWDFAEEFSGHDAAALILGIEPANAADEHWRVRVVLDRIELHYKAALHKHFHNQLGNLHEAVDCIAPDRADLESVELAQLHHESWLHDHDAPYELWLMGKDCEFEKQKFSRNSLRVWLEHIRMKSIYAFKLMQAEADAVTEKMPKWPWGEHHTKALGDLEAAGKRFWSNFDPAEPATANTNDTVIEWLIKERGSTENKAKAIASILRADGLTPGPRK